MKRNVRKKKQRGQKTKTRKMPRTKMPGLMMKKREMHQKLPKTKPKKKTRSKVKRTKRRMSCKTGSKSIRLGRKSRVRQDFVTFCLSGQELNSLQYLFAQETSFSLNFIVH